MNSQIKLFIYLLGEFLIIIPSVVKGPSRLRSRVFKLIPEYKDKVIWLKAQKLRHKIHNIFITILS